MCYAWHGGCITTLPALVMTQMEQGRQDGREVPSGSGSDAGTTARVLIIDDDEHMLAMLGEVLGLEGYEVLGAMDGAAAVGAIRKSRPDLILLDLMMPVMDGYSFLELYRQLPGPHVPVVIITAAAREQREGAADKADEMILKPFSVDHVLQIVNRYTGRPAR